ncbi:hypothetical protein V2J09_014120, partial [Rumex salicifolius]
EFAFIHSSSTSRKISFHFNRAQYREAISPFLSFLEASLLSLPFLSVYLAGDSSAPSVIAGGFEIVGDLIFPVSVSGRTRWPRLFRLLCRLHFFLFLRVSSYVFRNTANMVHKKTQMMKENPAAQRFRNIRPSAKNLSKTELGSVIFGCKHSTFKECIFKQLFGLPSTHYAYVRNVRPGMPLFLFNYSDRKLHGIYEAQSEGQMNINQYAWTFNGDDLTQFPAQVKVRIRQQCEPLTEDQFKPVIAKNYYEPLLFWFELDKAQTRQMIAFFMKSTAPHINRMPQSKSMPVTAKLLKRSGQQSTSSLESGGTSLNSSSECHASGSHQHKELFNPSRTKSWSSLFKQPSESKANKEQETAPSSNWSDHESENPNLICRSKADMDWESTYDEENMVHEDQKHESLANNGCVQLDEFEQSFEEVHLDAPETMIGCSNGNLVVSDDGTKSISENSSYQSNMEWGLPNNVNDWADISVADKAKVNNEAEPETPESLSDGAVDFSSLTEEIILNMTLSDLRIVALKLLHANEKMKSSHLMQDQTNHSLKLDLVQLNAESEVLKENLRVHESSCFLSLGVPDELNSILLVGGFDGSIFLPSLDSFVPSVDNVRQLKSMDIARAYATSVQLNNELYVLGGGDGKIWYDTVQSYSLDNDSWVSCPSLSKKKGNLAAIGLDGKIFAMGGGNVTDCIRDVEMLDLGFGKWISSTSMLQKRCAPAAAEIKGMLYVVGGYDGKYYLSSVEGYDPREHSWTKLQRMNTRRGSHAVTVLNEKLYAIGGHDGCGMVSSVEIYDPRYGSWMMAEPMNIARSYFGAVAIGGSIYSIGGMTGEGEISASVECYSEGYGWQLTNLKSVGKRSSFAAVSLAM